METINTATVFGSFAVKKLEEFKSLELESRQYLVRKIEKGTGLDSKGVVIEGYNEETAINSLCNPVIAGAFVEWFNAQAGECCKARIAQGATVIVKTDYDVESIAAMLEAKEVSEGRVSKEKIAAWFASSVSPVLHAAFREKLGAAANNDVILASLAMYQKVFVQFAKKEASWTNEVIAKVEKALSLLPDSTMKAYCEKKLPDFAEKSADMLGL